VLEQLPFVQGWGVEMALLIDIAERFGAGSIAQIDVGIRDSFPPLAATRCRVQAAEVMATMLSRVPEGSLLTPGHHLLRRADGSEVPLNLAERPPLASLRP
jgi:glucosyl-3-phosphoglycerate synthase